MALPRPKSIFDAAPAASGRKLGIPAAPTGMPFADPLISLKDEAEAVINFDDAEFHDWFEEQQPDRRHGAAVSARVFNDKMVHVWMKMTTAATKAQVAYTDGLRTKLPAHRPEASDYGPRHLSLSLALGSTEEERWLEEGIPPEQLARIQAEFDAWKAGCEAMRQKALTLAARAEKLQEKINFVA